MKKILLTLGFFAVLLLLVNSVFAASANSWQSVGDCSAEGCCPREPCTGFDCGCCEPSVCGNGVQETGEECDGSDIPITCEDAGFDSGSMRCTGSCVLDRSGCVGNVAAIPDPPPATCPNGVCAGGESCTNCPQDCGACPFCGDGNCDPGETCTTCWRDCGLCCGNGRPDPNEQCDNGDPSRGGTNGVRCTASYSPTYPPNTCQYCTTSCTWDTVTGPYCGDGTRDAAYNEECDLGTGVNSNAPNMCRPDCTAPYCGDGIHDYDSPYHDNEACDDGNLNSDTTPNACRSTCILPYCSDGVIDPLYREACDCGSDGSCTLAELGGFTCVSLTDPHPEYGPSGTGGNLDCYPKDHATECQFDTLDCCFDSWKVCNPGRCEHLLGDHGYYSTPDPNNMDFKHCCDRDETCVCETDDSDIGCCRGQDSCVSEGTCYPSLERTTEMVDERWHNMDDGEKYMLCYYLNEADCEEKIGCVMDGGHCVAQDEYYAITLADMFAGRFDYANNIASSLQIERDRDGFRDSQVFYSETVNIAEDLLVCDPGVWVLPEGNISGTVYDGDRNRLAGATVSVLGTDLSAVTASAPPGAVGDYLITNVLFGSYDIVASKESARFYDATRYDLYVPAFGTLSGLDFYLSTSDSTCQPDCTFSGDNFCHEECEGLNGCDFNPDDVANYCDDETRGFIVDYDPSPGQKVECCEGSPTFPKDLAASTEVKKAGSVARVTKTVWYQGKRINMVIDVFE